MAQVSATRWWTARMDGRGLAPVLIVILLLGLFPGTGWGQSTGAHGTSYVRTQWTAQDGLPVNSVLDIARTENGYLWLATYDGLVRFDGLDFKVYRSADHSGLPSNRIVRLVERGDEMWIRTEARHLVRFDRDTFSTVASNVRTFHAGTDGRVWIGTEAGVAVYRSGTIREVAPERIQGPIQTIWEQDNGTLWIGTEGAGMYRRSENGTVRHVTSADGLDGMTVGAFARAERGVWIGSWGGLQKWRDGRLWSTGSGTDAKHAVFALVRDSLGAAWVFSDDGVYRATGRGVGRSVGQNQTYNAASPPNGRFVRKGPDGTVWIAAGPVLYRNGTPILRTEHQVNRFLFDRHGALWVGTATEGLYRLRPSLFSVYGEREGLVSDNVYPIEQRKDGSIWLGTLSGGLARIEGSDVATFHPSKNGQTLKNIWSLHESDSGQLWVGSARLCAFSSGRCARPFSDGAITGTRIHAIYEDRLGRLWVGTADQGLYRCDAECTRAEGEWTRFAPANSALPHSYVRSIHETPQGTLWVGTNGGGIARYQDGHFTPITEDDGLSSNLVRDIYQDTSGILWVATEDQGLNRLVLNDGDSSVVGSVTTYGKEDGLFDNALHQILSDSRGRMWFSTNRGIFWVEKGALDAFAQGATSVVNSVSYGTSDGLPSREANGGVQPAGIRAQDGRLWFPTQEGIVAIDPSSVHLNEAPPPLEIERVQSGTQVVDSSPRRDIRLRPTQRSFRVEYTGLNVTSPKSVTFRYRLDGLQDTWQHVGERRTAFFTNVPPGTYTFQVQARVRGGSWSEVPAELVVSVEPHVYETWWFYAICALGLGVLAVGSVWLWMYRHRRRRERLEREVRQRTEELAAAKQEAEAAFETVAEQAEELRELDQMKSRLFVNISHELRTPLSLMLGPIQRVLDQELRAGEETEMLEVLQRNAKRLRRLVQQILDLARYDAGRLDRSLQRVEWAHFVEQRIRRLTPLAEAQDVHLSVETSGAEAPVILDPDHMGTVLANLVRNGLTYTPTGGRVEVSATVERGRAQLVVEDTGPGIPADKQEVLFDRFYRGEGQSDRGGPGLGLALTRALVHLHDGTIEVDTRMGEGCRFVVQWPQRPRLSKEGGSRSEADVGSTNTEWDPEHVLFHGEEGTSTVSHDVLDDAPPVEYDAGPTEDRTTILIVEDNRDVRRFVRRLLEPRYRILEAENGRQGLQRSRAALPDLIIADVMMPEMDGFAMVEALRKRPRTDCIPVVMLTARADESDQVDGLEEGADAYVTKPFDADVLRAQIDRLIRTRRTLRDRIVKAMEAQEPVAGVQMGFAPARENSFDQRVRSTIKTHLPDTDFSVEQLAEEVGVTRRTATRRIKETFGQTPSKLIRTIRVEHGAELLDESAGTISEVAYAVGFSSLSYFSRCFKDHFGVPPSTYVKEQ